ncbi:MAG: cofactor-independent phosphoglycerate mutase [Bacteroidales bacterium]|nr:cofactor-independent phosphoglycerate mutase [Candidatus Liminaster caballi]
MKYIIILADGAADEPLKVFGGKTPLQAAVKPNIDRIAREGINGRLVTVPEGYNPGSEIAHLGLLGYDVNKVFEGRGSLEAASMHVDIEDHEVAMRCNIICIAPTEGSDPDDIKTWVIKNHSAGNISTAEADELIKALNEELAPKFNARLEAEGWPKDAIRWFTGVSYRHLLKIRGGDKHVTCTPPHDRIGKPWKNELPCVFLPGGAKTSKLLRELMVASYDLLSKHPVNLRRMAEGKDPANMIWPWSLGYRPQMQTLLELFPDQIKSGAVISAVDLIFGIGVYCGLKKVEVEGATGLWDTNYEGKTEAALRELRDKDFVFLHVEATDEAGHDGEPELKKQCIESLDARCVKTILDEVSTWDETVRVAILPDHPTPIKYRTHTMTPVPFSIWQNHPALKADDVQTFDENACFDGSLGLLEGDQFIKAFLQG